MSVVRPCVYQRPASAPFDAGVATAWRWAGEGPRSAPRDECGGKLGKVGDGAAFGRGPAEHSDVCALISGSSARMISAADKHR